MVWDIVIQLGVSLLKDFLVTVYRQGRAWLSNMWGRGRPRLAAPRRSDAVEPWNLPPVPKTLRVLEKEQWINDALMKRVWHMIPVSAGPACKELAAQYGLSSWDDFTEAVRKYRAVLAIEGMSRSDAIGAVGRQPCPKCAGLMPSRP